MRGRDSRGGASFPRRDYTNDAADDSDREGAVQIRQSLRPELHQRAP